MAAPTLTAFTLPVTTGDEDSEITVTFADLIDKGDEADEDGIVTAFVILDVSSGTLKIGTSAETATPWNADTNNIINADLNAYWTPAANANGDLNAFTVVARDDNGEQSTVPVQALVTVTPVNDAPDFDRLLGAVASGTEDSEIAVTLANLKAQANDADADGTVNSLCH